MRLNCTGRLEKRKPGMEAKGLKMNMGKTKVMLSDPKTVMIDEKGKWPSDVCKKGVGNNSILCTCCQKSVSYTHLTLPTNREV